MTNDQLIKENETHISDTRLISLISKEFLKINFFKYAVPRRGQCELKKAKANYSKRYILKCSVGVLVREMQIKVNLRYHSL